MIIGNRSGPISWKIKEIRLPKKFHQYVYSFLELHQSSQSKQQMKSSFQNLGRIPFLLLSVIDFSLIIFLWVSTAFKFALITLPMRLSFGVISPCAIAIKAKTKTSYRAALANIFSRVLFNQGPAWRALWRLFASLAFPPFSFFCSCWCTLYSVYLPYFFERASKK